MANSYTTNAINIKSYNLSEADKIVVMYSKEHGIIRCVAKGTKKPNSKLGGRMDLLMANKLLIYKGKNLDVVCQADVLDMFKNIRKDITKLTYSMYCTELISVFGLENDNNSEFVYDLFSNTLKNIDAADEKIQTLFFTVRFQLILMELSGYALELDTCVRCNAEIEKDLFYFCVNSGGIICTDCKNTTEKNFDFNKNTRDMLKNIKYETNDKSINDFDLNLCFNLLKDYISCRSHKKMKSLDVMEVLTNY
jgi:DNA repair protein RecO (recombination protein O)